MRGEGAPLPALLESTSRRVGLQPNAQGKLLLTFFPVEGNAAVSGIQVLPQ